MKNKANFKGLKIHSHELGRPKHYESKYDVVDLSLDLPPLPFLVFDCIKRIIRLDKKGQKQSDLKKIEYNLKRLKSCERSKDLLKEFQCEYNYEFLYIDVLLDKFGVANDLTEEILNLVCEVVFSFDKLDIETFIKKLT